MKASDTLLDLGLDSMGQLTLLSELRGQLSADFSASLIDAMTTLQELAQLLENASTFELSAAV
nr:acyl carrier protein [Pseudomonas corrugata]